MRPLPWNMVDRVEKFMRDGEILLFDLRIFEQGGCAVASHEARRIRDLAEAMLKKIDDMEDVT